MKKIFIGVHNDDETLYGAYTIMKEKPLVVVVTDSYIQFERGDGITKEQRIAETEEAMKILGAEVKFLHIPDNKITHECLDEIPLDAEIYAPYPEPGGNPHHNIIGELASRWEKVTYYSTYTKDRPYPEGESVQYTDEMYTKKMKALDCYKSQLSMSNKYYFDKMRHKDECIIRIK